MSFESLNLCPEINKALSACGYTIPTPVQASSIPLILQGKDLVASAQTGTGKTAAFVLPALHHLASVSANKKTRILILTPTRELATQITKAAGVYGKFMRYNIVSLVGGMPYGNQIRDLARGADIIVATPGRLMDHIEQKRVDLSKVDMLILDEADRMLDMGFIEDVEFIAKMTPSSRQTLLFSATVDKQLSNIVRHLLKNPERIDLSNQVIASPQIKQELFKINNLQQKNKLLRHMLQDNSIFKAIIFTATKISADKIAGQLRDDGFEAAALHGDLRQNVRNRTVDALRRGKIQFLVATDVAARGIDISDITHVFNYDMPRFCEDYVHRIGRTGRAGKTGTAISFVMPTDVKHVQRIEKFIGERLKYNHQINVNSLADTQKSHSDKSDMEILTLKPGKSNRDYFLDDQDDDSAPQHRPNSHRKPRSDRNGSRSSSSFDREKSASRDGYRQRSSDRDDRSSAHGKRSFGSGEKSSSFRGKRSFDKSEEQSSFRGKRSFNKSDDSSSSRGRRSFDRNDEQSSFRGRRSSSNSDEQSSFRGRRSSGNSDEQSGFRGKRSFDKKDDQSSFRGKRSFGKSDEQSSSRGKRSFNSSESEGGRYRSKNISNDEQPRSRSSKSSGGFHGKKSSDRKFVANENFRGNKNKGRKRSFS